MVFPALYERMGTHPYSFSPQQVDAMEVWQVASLLGAWRIDESAVPTEPVRGRPISDSALIKARMAAAARGEGEPLWLFGEPRVPAEVSGGR